MVLDAETRKPLTLAMTAEHEDLLKAVQAFAQKEIVPIAPEFDESGEFPLETVRKMGEMGLTKIFFFEKTAWKKTNLIAKQ